MAARVFAVGFLVLCAASFVLIADASGGPGAGGRVPSSAPAPLAGSAFDKYQQMLKASDANSADDHYRLGEWAFKNGLPQVARTELKTALALEPGHLRATLLLKDVEAAIVTGPTTQVGRTTAEPNAFGTSVPREWLVPEEDMYRIKMEELRPEDRVPITFRNDVLNRFIKKWRGKEEFKEIRFEDTFRGWAQSNPAKVVDFMREKDPEDTDIKDDILVQNDPKFMTDFRTKVWPIVSASCATAQCHGGGNPKGGLRLLSAGSRNDRADYTNYLLVDGVVSRGRRMVDRSDPQVSLVLQFLLPEDLSQFRHPTPITAVAASRRDARYVTIVDWIRGLHKPPHPDYRLKFTPPLGMKLVHQTEVILPPPSSSSAPSRP